MLPPSVDVARTRDHVCVYVSECVCVCSCVTREHQQSSSLSVQSSHSSSSSPSSLSPFSVPSALEPAGYWLSTFQNGTAMMSEYLVRHQRIVAS